MQVQRLLMCCLTPVRLLLILLTLLTVALKVDGMPVHSNLLQVSSAAVVYPTPPVAQHPIILGICWLFLSIKL